ncbi:MAG: serine hydrolase, partial [Anaerolineae bacterium]
TIVEPDQSRARIESMVSTLAPVMEREPLPPGYYTATLPISTTGGIEGTPTVDYSGPLTWTLPHFAGYTGPLTETTGFFFDPGEPGYTFNVSRATTLVDLAVRAGMTEPITFEPELVPPPPIGPDLLLPPLKARLAKFPGVTSILVKDLGTGETIYESNVDYVLSGMSVVKIGIMVEVYRHFRGQVDAQTHQEMLDMLGSSSCNPCANRLLAIVGGGSRYDGAAQVTKTMRRLGLDNFYLCAPFQEVQWDDGSSGYAGLGNLVWAANLGQAQEKKTPGYDRCVRATPREMADLVEMIYLGSQDEGLLREAYPNIFSPQVCQDMIDIMAANDLRNMLGSGIPPEVKLAHKHGFSGYAVPWGDTRAEVGIVFAPGTNWLISFYIWQDTDWINWGINQPLYRDVSNMLYNYFSPEAQYWPLPPWAPTPEPAESTDGGA